MRSKVKKLEAALNLAVDMLSVHEPGDSRACSDEFVSLAAASIGDLSDPVMKVIDAANERNKVHQ